MFVEVAHWKLDKLTETETQSALAGESKKGILTCQKQFWNITMSKTYE